MKHQNVITKISAFTLSFVIVVISVFSCPIPVYATMGDSGITENLKSGWYSFSAWSDEIGIKLVDSAIWVYSQFGALADKDFIAWIDNTEKFRDMWWGEDTVCVDSENSSVTFDADFVALMKQALKEYQDEKYGYQILPTIKYDQIQVSDCSNGTEYRTVCELACKYGMIGYGHTNSGYSLTDLSMYLNGTHGFYMYAYGNTSYRVAEMNLTTWSQGYDDQFPRYVVSSENTDVLYTWEDVAGAAKSSGTTFGTWYGTFSGVSLGKNYEMLISAHGEDVLVFNSATSLKNYSVDKRTIFTTSDFYEDTGALTVSLDDLNKSIGDLTDLLDQFKDLIGKHDGGLTEDQLQKLLKEFLDEFFERLNNGDNNDNNDDGKTDIGDLDIPDGFFDTVMGYQEAILSYLGEILASIKELEFITWNKGDSSVSGNDLDLWDMVGDIFDNPEEGAQSAVDELSTSFSDIAKGITKKFPFSIPWDIYGPFTVFANVDPPEASSISRTLSGNEEGYIDTGQLYNADVTVYTVDSKGNAHDAPYFELPIVVESFGIEEYIIVDLKDFQAISTLSRTMVALTFGVFLMKFTVKLIEMFKGGTDE